MIFGPLIRVKRVSNRGTAYEVFERTMPRIPDDFVDCCIYLYPSHPDAESGANAGGSGFLFGVAAQHLPNTHYLYAVTNRHVIEDGSTVVRLNTLDGSTDIFDFSELDWTFHPDGDDIAIAALPPLTVLHKYKFLDDAHILTPALVDQYNIGPGDDIFVSGRFVNQDGKQKNIPSVRFGNLAQMPPAPVSQNRADGVYQQESFIVEARSISGYSGSPVFLALSSQFIRPDRPNPGELNRVLLLGVNWGHICDWHNVHNANGAVAGYRVQVNTGMMTVVPAWKLKELVDMPKIKGAREVSEANIILKKSSAVGVTDSAPGDSTDANPNAREDFMRLANAAARKQKQGE